MLVSLSSLLLLCAFSFNSQQDGKGGSCSPICRACAWAQRAHHFVYSFHIRILFGVYVHVYFTCLRAIISTTSDSLLLSFVLPYTYLHRLCISFTDLSPGDQSATKSAHIHSHPSTLPPVPLVLREDDVERTVLVTGSAGFIGYHVSRALVERWGATVVGLDNFNDYYDVQLKKDRTNDLIRAGVRVYRGDVCDSTLLSHLFSKYQFTDVVHLAAQAGVRHSLEQPVNYIQANVQCFLALLDTLTHQEVGHMANAPS